LTAAWQSGEVLVGKVVLPARAAAALDGHGHAALPAVDRRAAHAARGRLAPAADCLGDAHDEVERKRAHEQHDAEPA
jgi:hypothetical protein